MQFNYQRNERHIDLLKVTVYVRSMQPEISGEGRQEWPFTETIE
jgi:hypothetical protein